MSQSTILMENLDLPIALRRTRRVSAGPKVELIRDASTSEPKTPRRRKKAVRFSDPELLSSGLTPMVRRTSLNTPKRNPPIASTGSGSRLPVPSKSTTAIHSSSSLNSLHQTVDGRVERRVRRNGLRDMLSKIDSENRRKEGASKAEIAQLKEALKARDREIYELQNATLVIDTDRIWGLEQQINHLKKELARRSLHEIDTRAYSWKVPRPESPVLDFMDMTEDEEHFGDATIAQLQASTPSRARSSFPTPPATSPTIPDTAYFEASMRSPISDLGSVQDLPDTGHQELEERLTSFQLEISKLTTTLETYQSLNVRLGGLLSTADDKPSAVDDTPESLTAIENQVVLLVQSVADRTTALSDLTAAIGTLGFPGDDASEMLASLASGFRAARLELEYLTPGEVTLPLTSHGAEVLDLMLTRLRSLAKKSKEDEDCIDEYHEIEQSLRKQLDSRVSVMDGLKEEMGKAQRLMDDKNRKIKELEVGNERLKGAVDGYVRDISELEKLVERMEQESRRSAEAHLSEQKSNQELLAAKDATIAELEDKIGEAVLQTAELLKEMGEIEDRLTQQTTFLNRQHGAALALRDARVTELRSEIDRVNESLRSAYETIHGLRVENGGLRSQMASEKQKAKVAMDSMKAELQRVLQMSQDFLNTPKRSPQRDRTDVAAEPQSSPSAFMPNKRMGEYLLSSLARRGSKALRGRQDSGIGVMDEDDVDV